MNSCDLGPKGTKFVHCLFRGVVQLEIKARDTGEGYVLLGPAQGGARDGSSQSVFYKIYFKGHICLAVCVFKMICAEKT